MLTQSMRKASPLRWSGDLRDSFGMAKISLSVLFAAPSRPNIAKTHTVTSDGSTRRQESQNSDEELF